MLLLSCVDFFIFHFRCGLGLVLGELIFRVHGRTPNSYLLFWDEARHQEICAVATKYDDEKKPCLWAIRRGNSCMGKSDGVFIYEPQPSSRDDEFFAEYRFASFEEAERIYLSFHYCIVYFQNEFFRPDRKKNR